MAGQIRERKWDDHHIACYKSFHASSSSREDQSSAQAVWANGKKDSPLGDDAAFRLFKKAKKSRTSRRVSSGTLSSSAISIADDMQVKKTDSRESSRETSRIHSETGGCCEPPKARPSTLRQSGNRIVRLSARYGLIAICPYVAGLGLRKRNGRAGFRFVGTPRSSSAPMLSDARKIGPVTRHITPTPFHTVPWRSPSRSPVLASASQGDTKTRRKVLARNADVLVGISTS